MKLFKILKELMAEQAGSGACPAAGAPAGPGFFMGGPAKKTEFMPLTNIATPIKKKRKIKK